MTYVAVSDFKHGVNRLRPQVAGIPGSLWTAQNAVITRGGDVESAKKFVPEYTLPAGTFGLANINGVPYVFGTIATPAGIPSDISYQQLTYTGAANLLKIHDARPFSANMYVIAEFDDGDVRHFYNGAEVTEWRGVADAAWSYSTISKLLAQKINARSDVVATAIDTRVKVKALVAGTPFTISTAVIDDANVPGSLPTATLTTIQANVVGVAEVRASGTVTITAGSVSPGINFMSQVAVGASNLLPAPVDFVLDASGTANAIALAITSAAVGGYTATSVGPVITILAPPALGAAANGLTPVATVAGNLTAGVVALAGGVTAVVAVAQISQVAISATTPDTLDTWKITVNATTYLTTGRASATGKYIHVVKRRVWIPVGSFLYFCKLSNPAVWTTKVPSVAIDPGFIDTSQDSEGSDDITSMEEHNDGTAIFSTTSVRIYALDTDASLIKLLQPLRNTGSVAGKATVQYGATEVYYLSMTGLAAIRSRLGSSFVVTIDVASGIFPYLLDFMASVGDAVVSNAAGVIEPREGRYMIGMSNKVFVLSEYTDSGVTGWSWINLAFTIEQFLRVGNRIMARAGSTVYVYGGIAGNVYPAANESPVDIELPFLTASDPAGKKSDGGFDMAGTGVWNVTLRTDPNDTTKVITVGNVSKISYPNGSIRVPIFTTHIAPHLVCSSGGKATLSSLAIHYTLGESA